MHGHLDTVQLLLSWRVDINAQNDVSRTTDAHTVSMPYSSSSFPLCVRQWGCTALMLAARYDQVATLKLLMLFQPDTKAIDKVRRSCSLASAIVMISPTIATFHWLHTGREDSARLGRKCRN
jgi:ankyrin repeat protein